MAVNIVVDGTTYEGINTITTGGKTLRIKAGGGGAEWIDPMDYYAEHRPSEWPTVPLPSDMEDSESADYADGKTKFFLLYRKLDSDIFITDRIQLTGTNIVATIQKYANASTTVGGAENVPLTVSGNSEILNFEYTNADADWNNYRYILLTITADTMTGFNYYGQQRWVNGYPLNTTSYCTSLVEFSGTAPELASAQSGTGSNKYMSNVEYFSMGDNAVTNMSNMFSGCSSLQTIPQLDTGAVTDMSNMFYQCSSLQTIPQLDTGAVTNMSSMFQNCYSLQTIPQLDTGAVTNMNNMFSGCSSLQTIDISKWNFTSTGYVNNMFANCYGLKNVVIREFGTGNVIYANPFNSSYHITGTTNAQYNPNGDNDGFIYVPDADVATIKAATNWSAYASQIKGLSELAV